MGKADSPHQNVLAPVWRFLKTEKESLWIILIHACGVGLLSLTLPIAIQSLVNTVAFGTVLQPIVVLTLAVIFFLTASAILKLFQTVAAELLQRRIFVRYSIDIAARLPHLAPETRGALNVQETVNRFFDIFLVQKALAFLLLEGVGLVLQASVGLVLLAFYHPFLLAFGFLLLAGIYVVCRLLGQGTLRTAIEESTAKYAMAAWLEDIARLPITLGSPTGNQVAVDRADKIANTWLDARESHFRKVLGQTVGTLALQVLASGSLLGFGGWLVIKKQLSLGQLVAAELIVTGVLYSISKMGKQFEAFYDVVAGLNKLEHILDLPIEDRPGAPVANADGAWKVTLKNVSHQHLSSGRKLRNIQLEIPAGNKVLIRGASGSGKSLLANLLRGASIPESGQIFFQDQDLRYLSYDDIRNHVRLVQEVELIDGTIEENLTLGIQSVSLVEIEKALQVVLLDQQISNLNLGLKTRMNPRGGPLTYSQARRLMLARATLAQPKLLILDKNSDWMQSPVSGGSGAEILQRLFKSLSDCTIIVLAEPDFASQEVTAGFNHCYDLINGELKHASPVNP
ncbi:MAG: hypothetical protein RJB38_2400 [Pseudomonadota bacterium]|jgi:ABC-type bacteriocin/lantibiotic exporter with double-glycine peptidase domain